MKVIRVALLQMSGCGSDKIANQAKGDMFCRRAHAEGADVALFPEMWSIGMTFYDPKHKGAREEWQSQAKYRNKFRVMYFSGKTFVLHGRSEKF